MPIDFLDTLRSLRADGILAFSNAIRAAAGKKIVANVTDGQTTATLEVSDENGNTSEIVLSKGGEGATIDLSDESPAGGRGNRIRWQWHRCISG